MSSSNKTITKEALRAFLQANNLTATDLASFFGVSPRTVQKWLSERPSARDRAPLSVPPYVAIVLCGETIDEFVKRKKVEEWREHSARNREHVRRAMRGGEPDTLF